MDGVDPSVAWLARFRPDRCRPPRSSAVQTSTDPTIGTAIALARQGLGPHMTLELGVEPIACHATKQSARFSTQVPLKILVEPQVADVADVLGLTV